MIPRPEENAWQKENGSPIARTYEGPMRDGGIGEREEMRDAVAVSEDEGGRRRRSTRRMRRK